MIEDSNNLVEGLCAFAGTALDCLCAFVGISMICIAAAWGAFDKVHNYLGRRKKGG